MSSQPSPKYKVGDQLFLAMHHDLDHYYRQFNYQWVRVLEIDAREPRYLVRARGKNGGIDEFYVYEDELFEDDSEVYA